MTEPPRHPDIPYNVKEAALSLFSRTHIRNGSYILFNIHSSVVEVFVSSAFNFPLCPVGITLAQLIDRLMSLPAQIHLDHGVADFEYTVKFYLLVFYLEFGHYFPKEDLFFSVCVVRLGKEGVAHAAE